MKSRRPWKKLGNNFSKQTYVVLIIILILSLLQFLINKKPTLSSKTNCKLFLDRTFFYQIKNCPYNNQKKITSISKKLEENAKFEYSHSSQKSFKNCSVLNLYEWNKNHIKPRFVLRKDKFILPLLYNGPNNQMLGFQQSMIMAVLLNRLNVVFRL